MTASRFEHPSHIRIYPDHAIFAICLFLFFCFSTILDSILDYGEGTFSLHETSIMIIFVIVFIGGAAFGFYLLLFAILTIDSQSGIRIFSRFSTMDAKWDQIESLTLRLNLNLQRTPSRSGGLMMLFAIPYQYHTRPVTLRIKTILGKEKTFHLRINLTKINHLLTLLANVPVLEGRRSEVDISKMKKKKKDLIEIKTTKQANLRALWQFAPSDISRRPTLSNFYIQNEQGVRWQKSYSPQAQILKKAGWGTIFSLSGILLLFALHISYADNPLLWSILLAIFGVLFCFGFILAWFTPEMREKSKID